MDDRDRLMQRNTEALERNTEALARLDTIIQDQRQFTQNLVADYREFTREVLLRFDKSMERRDRVLEEIVAEQRAQRGALLKILDRPDNRPAGPAPAT